MHSVLGARQEWNFEGSVMREKVMFCVCWQSVQKPRSEAEIKTLG